MKHPRNSTSDLSTHLVNCTIADSNADSNANNTTDNSRVALVRPPRGSGIYGRCGTVIGTSAYVVCNRSISAGPPANVLCKLDLHLQQFCELSEVHAVSRELTDNSVTLYLSLCGYHVVTMWLPCGYHVVTM